MLRCFAATSPGRTRSPLRTSLRSLQAVRNSRSSETDDCHPADQILHLSSGLDVSSHLKKKKKKRKVPTSSPNWFSLVMLDESLSLERQNLQQLKPLFPTPPQVYHLPEWAQAAGLHHFQQHPWTPVSRCAPEKAPQSRCRPWRGCRGLSLSAPAGFLTRLRDTWLFVIVFLPLPRGRPLWLGPEMHHPLTWGRRH